MCVCVYVCMQAPLKGQSQIISINFSVADGGVLATRGSMTVDIFALNMLGSSFVESVILRKWAGI